MINLLTHQIRALNICKQYLSVPVGTLLEGDLTRTDSRFKIEPEHNTSIYLISKNYVTELFVVVDNLLPN